MSRLLVVLIISLTVTITSVVGIIKKKEVYKDFETIEATIEKVYHTDGTEIGQIQHLVDYRYTVGGQEYKASRRVYNKRGREKGKKEKIKYDPDNPEIIEDTYLIGGLRFVSRFFCIISMGIAVIITEEIKKRKEARDGMRRRRGI